MSAYVRQLKWLQPRRMMVDLLLTNDHFPIVCIIFLRLAQHEIKIPTMDLYQSSHGPGSELAIPKCHSVRRKNAKTCQNLWSPGSFISTHQYVCMCIYIYVHVCHRYIYNKYPCISIKYRLVKN